MPRQNSRAGLTLLEMVIVMGILSGVMILGASTLMGVVQRFTADIQLDRTEKAANRVMTEFATATKAATGFAIYDNAATWKISPIGTQGNFVLVTQADGSQIGFAYVSGEVQIIHEPATLNQVLVCNRSAVPPAGGSFASMEDGIPTLAWAVHLPAEKIEFRVSAQPLHMQ